MRHFLQLTICTAVLVSFFCQFAAAKNSFLPDNNLGRYQSLKYTLTVQEDIKSFGGQKVTDESVQEKIDDFFDAKHIPCTRQTSASTLPCLIIKVIPQLSVGLVPQVKYSTGFPSNKTTPNRSICASRDDITLNALSA